MPTSAPSKSKSSKAGYHLFEQTWIECEDGKTKAPSRSGKSKKCKASKAADTYAVTDAVQDTAVEPVVELFDPPKAEYVRQHIDHVFIFPLPKLIIVSLTLNTTLYLSLNNRISTQIHQLSMGTLFL